MSLIASAVTWAERIMRHIDDVFRGKGQLLSHQAGEHLTSVVNCCRKVGIFATAPHANGIRDIKVNDIMRLHLVLSVRGLIHHAEHNPDELRIG